MADTLDGKVANLRQHVDAAEQQLAALKLQLEEAERQAKAAHHVDHANSDDSPLLSTHDTFRDVNRDQDAAAPNANRHADHHHDARWPLLAGEYVRYGRQMIMPEVGLHGQLRLKNARVLIVGVGGLGCPAAAYLAAAGVGTLGLVDGDTVELSNLHRQIAHATDRIGVAKVDSACDYLRSLNPLVTYVTHNKHLKPEDAIDMFSTYDLVLDCTDHPSSRYLISDACVLTGKPLVSASALRAEGQLIVLNDPPTPQGVAGGGPCYRCIFPKPPPPESVLSCGEGGILGTVVGAMGVLQALEAIKLIISNKKSDSTSDSTVPPSASGATEPKRPSLLMFSACSNPQFRTVRMRSRRIDCAACSSTATVSAHSLTSGSLDYLAFCGAVLPVDVLPPHARISAADFARLHRNDSNILLDVRDETQYAIAALRDSINIPWTGSADSWLRKTKEIGALDAGVSACYVVCRFGNDSQLAVKALLDTFGSASPVRDIKGGFEAWRRDVDPEWPNY